MQSLIPRFRSWTNCSPLIHQRRTIFWLLYSAVNKLDPDRIKLIGPDRACAEWLVKCGAAVGFHSHNKLVDDYTRLGLIAGRNMKLREVYAEEATIMNIEGVDMVEKMTFIKCGRFDDSCLRGVVKYTAGSLMDLEIVSCDVSDHGLSSLDQLQKLNRLRLFELPGVKKKKEMFEKLTDMLPTCSISFEDHDGFHMSTGSTENE